ncbi:hypothetical protein [uncultured Arcobacter sp.]|uniref:hypothetical protein n=1 Tax=uncultured Arcobacter sp. TaxID=165434 RepID=UPI002612FA9A|nr:hypothetical protein [uncultured Arcobacter sp.]
MVNKFVHKHDFRTGCINIIIVSCNRYNAKDIMDEIYKIGVPRRDTIGMVCYSYSMFFEDVERIINNSIPNTIFVFDEFGFTRNLNENNQLKFQHIRNIDEKFELIASTTANKQYTLEELFTSNELFPYLLRYNQGKFESFETRLVREDKTMCEEQYETQIKNNFVKVK